MITVYTHKHIFERDPKLYVFLIQNNILEQFLKGLNFTHDREQQYSYWMSRIHRKIDYEGFSVFGWADYYKMFNSDNIDWYVHYMKFRDSYNNIIIDISNYKLIKLI